MASDEASRAYNECMGGSQQASQASQQQYQYQYPNCFYQVYVSPSGILALLLSSRGHQLSVPQPTPRSWPAQSPPGPLSHCPSCRQRRHRLTISPEVSEYPAHGFAVCAVRVARAFAHIFKVPPAAPTPPNAAASTASSYYPYGYNPYGYHQETPVAVHYAEHPPTYVEPHREHGRDPERPALQPYSTTWARRHSEHSPPPPMSTNVPASNRATAGSSHPSRTAEPPQPWREQQYHWYYREGTPPPPPFVEYPPSPGSKPMPLRPPEVPNTQVHVCAVCYRVRSASFHRANPIIPGQQHRKSVCRRCRRKEQEEREAREKELRDLYDEDYEIMIDERRGRARSRSSDREEVYVIRRNSRSQSRIVKERKSSGKLGLHILSGKRSPSPPRRESRVRAVSVSPHGGIRIEHTDHWDRHRPPPPLESPAADRMASHPSPFRRVVRDPGHIPPAWQLRNRDSPRRVHFSHESATSKAIPDSRKGEQPKPALRDYEYDYGDDSYSDNPYAQNYLPPLRSATPTREFERLRIRDYSPAPRGRSPPRSPTSRHTPRRRSDGVPRSPSPEEDDIRVEVSSRRKVGKKDLSPSPPRSRRVRYRITESRPPPEERAAPPPENKEKEFDSVTASDSESEVGWTTWFETRNGQTYRVRERVRTTTSPAPKGRRG